MTNALFNDDECKQIARIKQELYSIIQAQGIFKVHPSRTSVEDGTAPMYLDDSHMKDVVIAGGAFASLLNKETPRDIDVFILNNQNLIFHSLFQNKPGKWSVRYHDEDDDSDYANPHVFATATNLETNIQYILTNHKTRQDLLKDFDYIHCTASYVESSKSSQLMITRPTYDAIIKKHLIPQDRNRKIKDWRTQKFHSRGWKHQDDVMLDRTSNRTLGQILADTLAKQPQNDINNIVFGKIQPTGSTVVDDILLRHGTDAKFDDLFK